MRLRHPACLLLITLLFAAPSSAQYALRTIAGGGPPDNSPAAGVGLVPSALALDAAGNLFVTDPDQNRVYKISSSGLLSVAAGNGFHGLTGDGAAASKATLNSPGGLAVDSAGNLYIADQRNNRIRKVSPAGVITTVAGTGEFFGYSGDGGPATAAQLDLPSDVAMDGAGNLYIAVSSRVRKVSPGGVITTVAGGNTSTGIGDGGLATRTTIAPLSVAVDGAGNLYILDNSLNTGRIRKVSPNGIINTLIEVPGANHIISDLAGNLFISSRHRVQKLSATGVLSTVAGSDAGGFAGDGAASVNASLNTPLGMALDTAGNLFIADKDNHRIRKVSTAGIITTIAGNGAASYSGDGGQALNSQFGDPAGLAMDSAGNLYVADRDTNRIRRVTPAGVIDTIAGNGTSGYSGDGEPATSAQLNNPTRLAVDCLNNLYVADTGNHRVRKVSPGGIITTVAGNGSPGFSGDGGAAMNAQLSSPRGLAVDNTGNLYIADSGNHRVRKVSPDGVMATVAGNGGTTSSGDGGPATSASLKFAADIALDPLGNLYIADSTIRKVSSNGRISVIPGSVSVDYPVSSIVIDSNFNLYIAYHPLALDYPYKTEIRKIMPNGTNTILASGLSNAMDGEPALYASLSFVDGLVVDAAGTLYFADPAYHRVRFLGPSIALNTYFLSFTWPHQSSVQPVSVMNSNGQASSAVTSGVEWLSVSPGMSAGIFNVSVNPAGLAVGLYEGRIRFSSPQGVTDLLVHLDVSPPCVTGLSPSNAAWYAPGGVGGFTVNAPAGCQWTASSDVNWLSFPFGGSGVGTGILTFGVSPYEGPSTRSGTITIDGSHRFSVTQSSAGSRFVPVPPCRIADTRNPIGPFGGPRMNAGETRSFAPPESNCEGIPAAVHAYSLNVTVVPSGPLGYLSLWPTGQPRPLVSTLNSFDGRVKANAAIVPAGTSGEVSVFVTDTADVVLDINGYFVSALYYPGRNFHLSPPCRVADTRLATGPLGGPSMASGQSRTFPVASSGCGAPATAQAYSLNVTAVPNGPLAYLTAWPSGAAQPFVSTLNAFTGTVTANAAIVPAGSNGDISFFATNHTDLVLDINGYFGPPDGNALAFYPVTPCRISDTRLATGTFGGPILAANETRNYPVPASACNLPPTARAYSLNVTVVPQGPLSYLTLWPSGVARPLVSTLNSFDGSVVSNAAIVPASASGAVSVYVTNPAHVILDINGYFQ